MHRITDTNSFFPIRGISQMSRTNGALDFDYFKIEDKGIHDMTLFCVKYSKLIAYYNEQNNYDGDWSAFFEMDPTVRLILLSGFDVSTKMEKFNHHLGVIKMAGNDLTTNKEVLNIVLLISKSLKKIEKSVLVIKAYENVYTELINLIKHRLCSVFRKILTLDKHYLNENGSGFNYDLEFSDYWFDSEEYRKIPSQTDLVQWIESLFYEFIEGIRSVKKTSEDFLNNSVLKSGNIQPHIAIYLVFCDLYGLAAEKINGFTERHLDFYYKEVLRMSHRMAIPDKAFVIIDLEENVKSFEIQNGTRFVGGEVNGEDLIYESEGDYLINENQLIDVITLDMKEVLDQKIKIPLSEKEEVRSYFKNALNSNRNSVHGFSFKSHYLKHPEGVRKFHFSLLLNYDSFEKLVSKSNLSSVGLSVSAQLNEWLANSILCSFTTLEGTFTVPQNQIDFTLREDEENEKKKFFDINLVLKASDPPVTDFSGEGVLPPEFTFYTTEVDVFARELLNLLSFSLVDLEIEVLSAKELIVQNEFGIMDVNSPFEPFGSVPELGSKFYIGHKSLFLFPVEDLRVNLEWSGIPNVVNGFGDYYYGYDFIEDNSSFKVKISALKEANWVPEEDNQVIDLFQNVAINGLETKEVSPIRRITEIDTLALKLHEASNPSRSLELFDISSKEGFICMELCWPPNAFGNLDYPNLMAEASAKSTKKFLSNKPNEPYVPTLKSMSIDYKVKVRFDKLNDADLIVTHKWPFGKSEIHRNEEGCFKLIPDLGIGSSLYLGISDLHKTNTISIFFNIKTSNNFQHRNLIWSEFKEQKWVTLRNNQIISNSTDGFTKSGIIVFELSTRSAKLPKLKSSAWNQDLRWLKLECGLGTSFNDLILDIIPQAVMVKCLNPELSPEPIRKPESIVALENPVYEISGIRQPYISHGGQLSETASSFYNRISERLRHKDRAYGNWDITRLILANFPEVQIVKCLNHTDIDLNLSPGSVLITVIPHPVQKDTGMVEMDYFSAQDLELMCNFIKSRLPEFTKVFVVNPIYEKVRVKFNVKFHEGFDENHFINVLQKSIAGFLNPWQSGTHGYVNFGDTVNSSTILNYIENQHYVDYILNFSTFHLVNGSIQNLNEAKSHNTVIRPTTPISVITSDSEHDVFSISNQDLTDKSGINEMMIGTDFLVEKYEDEYGDGINYLILGKNFQVDNSDGEDDKATKRFKFKIDLN